MNVNAKKVMLFLVDGPTDEDALSPILKTIFKNSQVKFHVIHGDITSDQAVNSNNAVKTVNGHIHQEMNRYGLTPKDILKIIHLVDTDGAFIPHESVTEGQVDKLRYEDNRIVAKNVQRVIERNERKTRIVQRLHLTKKIGGCPYSVYYFSRNREHVLHRNSQDLTDEQKADQADLFAETYEKDPGKFIHFLANSDFTVKGDYEETWNFIFEENHSLHRYCNLHLLFSGQIPESEV